MNPSVEEHKIDLSLKASRRHRTGIECRREQRIPVTGSTKIILFATRTSRIVSLRDVSRSGIGILLDAPLQRGDRFLLLLPSAVASGKRAMVCTVVYCRAIPKGEFEVGAVFTNVLASGLLPPATDANCPAVDAPASPIGPT
jgi:hypothetical protein